MAVGRNLRYSSKWKTFPDFLSDYIKEIIDPAWGNAEIAKPFAERHILLQWYDRYCRYQAQCIKTPGEVVESRTIGVVGCYLGLAYSLFLLDHNVELQKRLVNRLRNPGNFQGAYYELMVANSLIRAGFELALEDEADGSAKHCEFSAVSKATGKKYWVEAKMRSVAGLLGKNQSDGTADANPLSHLIPHLNAALAKPASDGRLIFVDLNAEPEVKDPAKPAWVDRAGKRLERYEQKELTPGVTGYVFVTNMAFHRSLDEALQSAVAPFGLGIMDFNRPGYYRLSEAYRLKRKHIDAHNIAEAFARYPQIPSTFGGELPSETFGSARPRIIIGETYFFEDIGEKGTQATVTTASVSESEKRIYVGVTDEKGQSSILFEPLTDEQLSEYKAHPDAYFGKVLPVSKKVETPAELFDWLIEVNRSTERETLLVWLSGVPGILGLEEMSHEDLLGEYCERMVASLEASGFFTKSAGTT